MFLGIFFKECFSSYLLQFSAITKERAQQYYTVLTVMMASMTAAYQDFSKLNQEPMLRKCTPFCDKNKECLDHHELLVAIVNCTDMLGSLSNLDNLKECVDKYTKGGWGKDDDVPDAVLENRCPLIHWAAALGKCNALEWMLASGFSPVAKSSGNGETALHRAIKLLYKSRPKFTVKELNPKFAKMVGLLKEALLIKDEAHGDTPFHIAANMLVNGDHKPNFFLSCVEVIVNKAKKMGDYSDAILNAVNDAGETVLHILARGEKHKVEYCTQAIRSLIVPGADRSIRNNEGQTALDIALASGTESIVEELIKVGSFGCLIFVSILCVVPQVIFCILTYTHVQYFWYGHLLCVGGVMVSMLDSE